MRLILTGLAALIVLALSAALVGPGFVDWTAHRAFLEAELTKALGAQTRLAGPIELRLLPSPRLSAGGASLGTGEGGAPRIESGPARFEMSAPSLMRGEWRFVEARLDRPVATLSLDKDGRLIAPALGGASASVEALRILDGVAILRGADGTELGRLERITVSGSAEGFAGPFKGQGKVGAAATGLRFATGEIQGGRMRLKLALDASATTPRVEFDGAALFGGALGYEGQAVADGALDAGAGEATPWRLAATVKADAQGASADPLDMKIGAEERPVGFSGRAAFDAAGLRVALSGRQVDLDKALGSEGRPATPRQALAAASALAGRLSASAGRLGAGPLAVEVSPGVVTLGGEAIADATLSMTRAAASTDVPAPAPALKIEASLPGRTRLAAEGVWESGAAARFKGRVDASTYDARRLRAWLGDLLPEGATPPFAAMAARGEAEVSEVALSLRNAEMKLDRTPLSGDVTYVAPVAGERGRIFADLSSDALDIDGAPDLSALSGGAPDYDFTLRLDARAVRVARFGEGTLDAGRIRIAAQREGGRSELERLSVEGLGGANLTAQGALDQSGGRFALDLDAERLGDLAGLIGRIAPGRFSAALAARAARLSPAKLTLTAQAGPDFSLRSAVASGVFAGAKASARADAGPGGLAAHVEIAQEDLSALLRQIGLDSRGPPRLGAAKIVADATMPAGGLVNARATLDAPGAKLVYEGGFLGPALLAGQAQALGAVSLDADAVAPLLTAAGVLAPAGYFKGGADVAAQIAWTAEGIAFEGLHGWAFGTRISNGVGLVRPASADRPRARIEGRLAMERLALPDVAALALGVSPPGPAARTWSDRAFAPALSSEAPEAAVALEAGRIDTGTFGETGPARASLSLAPGVARLDAIDAPFAGGRLTGETSWRRDGLDASFSARLAVAGVAFDVAPAAGKVDATLDLAGSGRSPAGIVSTLGGEGRVALPALTLRRAALGALAAAIRGVEAQQISLDKAALERALTSKLDAGERALTSPAEAALGVATGVARVAPIMAMGADETLATTVALDLRAMSYELRERIGALASPSHWSGSPPSFDAIWRGAPGVAATREVDVASLLNGLAARSLGLELERVEALEAEQARRAEETRRLDDQRQGEAARRAAEEAARVDALRRAQDDAIRRAQERAQEEATKIEASKAEATKSEAAKSEAAKSEAARIEAAKRREMQRVFDSLPEPALRGEPPLRGEKLIAVPN